MNDAISSIRAHPKNETTPCRYSLCRERLENKKRYGIKDGFQDLSTRKWEAYTSKGNRTCHPNSILGEGESKRSPPTFLRPIVYLSYPSWCWCEPNSHPDLKHYKESLGHVVMIRVFQQQAECACVSFIVMSRKRKMMTCIKHKLCKRKQKRLIGKIIRIKV